MQQKFTEITQETIDEAAKLALSLLKDLEGFRPEPYRCTAGKLTIGYGRTQDVTPSSSTDEDTETKYLEETTYDILYWLLSLHKAVSLTSYQIAALISFIYNVGQSAYKESTLRKLIDQSNFKGASNEFGKWIYVSKSGKKVVDQGLKGRRRPKERNLFLGKSEPVL